MRALLASTFGLIVAGLVWGQAPGMPQGGLGPAKAAKKLKRSEIVQILAEEVEVPAIAGGWKLGPLLKWLQSKAGVNKGTPLPIFVNYDGFKDENPDAPDVVDTHIKLSMPRLTVGEALGEALDQVPTANACFLIRQGKVEITTDKRARPQYLLGEKVFAVFKNTALSDALDELSEQTGVTFVIDPRVSDKAKGSISATFAGNSALAAVVVLTNMAGVEPMVLGDIVYMTTAANVKTLQPLQQQLMNFSGKGKVLGPPNLGGPGA